VTYVLSDGGVSIAEVPSVRQIGIITVGVRLSDEIHAEVGIGHTAKDFAAIRFVDQHGFCDRNRCGNVRGIG
jgi:hypothetical protein